MVLISTHCITLKPEKNLKDNNHTQKHGTEIPTAVQKYPFWKKLKIIWSSSYFEYLKQLFPSKGK